MVDPIAIVEKIIGATTYIHQTVQEVKKFKDLARDLNYKIELLEPSIQVLVGMKNQREQLIAAQKDNPKMHLFTKALNDLADCVEKIKLFITDHKDVAFYKKLWNHDSIKEQYEEFANTLDTLKTSIEFAVLVDLASRKEKPSLQSFLECFTPLNAPNKEEEKEDVDNTNNERLLQRAKQEAKLTESVVDLLNPQDLDTIMDTDINVHESLKQGSGTIHRVTFKKLLYKGHTEATAKMVASLEREDFDVLTRLHHPHIAQVFGLAHGKLKATYLLREYAPATLQDHLLGMSEPISSQLLNQWTRESAEAVKYLHKEGVVVGNIRASNCLLFLRDEGRLLKLTDFGLKRKLDVASKMERNSCYIAPELKKGEVFSQESDMFAFGMLVLDMINGEVRPINGEARSNSMLSSEPEDDIFKVVNDHCKVKIPNEERHPNNFINLVYRCLRSSPTARPTACQALEIVAGPDEPTEIAAESYIEVNQSTSENSHIDIVIQMKDASGADVKTDNKMEIEGVVYSPRGDHQSIEMIKTLEGIYKARFSPKHDGKYKIVVQVNGDTVGNCPYDYYHLREMAHKLVAHKNTTPKGLNKPHDIKEFNDSYIIADTFNNRVLKTNRSFVIINELQEPLGKGRFKPYGIATTDKEILVTDNCQPGRIVVYEDEGLGKLWEFGNQDLQRPTGIAALKNKIYVIDHGLNCVKVYTVNFFERTATCVNTISKPGSGPHDLNCPWLATFDTKGQLLVADSRNKRIQIFDPKRSNHAVKTIPVIFEGTPVLPRGLAVDSDNKIYVTVMAFTGIVLKPCLQCVVVFNEEGQCIGNFGSKDRLSWPRGIAVIRYGKDSHKALIANNHTITEYDIY